MSAIKDSTQEENHILQQLANADLKAFDYIYFKYSDLLLAQTIRITKDSFASEDIIQDVFTKLWERRTSFTAYNKISGWLFLTTFHASMNYLKKVLREKKRHEAFEYNKSEAEQIDFAMKEAQFALMEAAIAQLPAHRKLVFTLCKYEGWSYEAIAEHLSISINTVKDHLKKANVAIKKYILEHGDQVLAISTIVLFYQNF